MTSEAVPPRDSRNYTAPLILKRARGLYVSLCDELERADQEDNEYCLLLSNCADDLYSFISGIERLQEGRV
jgi:hypothetical protein